MITYSETVHSEASLFLKLYELSFPEEERRLYANENDLEDFRKRNNELFHILTIYNNDTAVGFLTYWTFTDYLYIEHFFINPDYRGKGLGGEMLDKFTQAADRGVILETECPNNDVSKRRIAFYKRHGFKLHNEIEYRQPPYSPTQPFVELKIMSYGKHTVSRLADLSPMLSTVYGYDATSKKKKHFTKHDWMIGIDFLVVSTLLIFACVYAWQQFIHNPPYVDYERYPIRGIDISSHNGMMNLDAAASDGISFIFIKASEGTTFRDSNFRLNYDKARHAGLSIGAYHFFRFDCDGVEQAVNLLSAIGNRQLDLGVAIDVEANSNPKNIPIELINNRLTAMADYLNLRGYRVTFYSNKAGYYDYISESFKGFPLWICAFSETPINTEWTFWQYNHRGHVKGINGDVDMNAFYGSEEDWEQYLRECNTSK
jgi:lysozyme